MVHLIGGDSTPRFKTSDYENGRIKILYEHVLSTECNDFLEEKK